LCFTIDRFDNNEPKVLHQVKMFVSLKIKSDLDPDMENLDAKVLCVSENLEAAKVAIVQDAEKNNHSVENLQWLDKGPFARQENWRMVYFVTDPAQFACEEYMDWSKFERWEIQEVTP